jgi:hypothetical protein
MNASDYARRAQLHRPSDPSALARAARELAAQGLTLADIACALRLDVDAVQALLSDAHNARDA